MLEITLWQLLMFVVGLVVTVFGVYGALIKRNRVWVEDVETQHQKLHGRLYGEDRGNSGDVNNMKNTLNEIEAQQEELCETTRRNRQTLQSMAFTLDELVEVLSDLDDVNGDLDRLDRYHDDRTDDTD